MYLQRGSQTTTYSCTIQKYEVLIQIEDGVIYAGDLPIKQLKLVYDWLSGNSRWALEVFYELNPQLK